MSATTKAKTKLLSSVPNVPGAGAELDGELLGHVEPRLFTPPLRQLTPETSYGFDVIDFAERVLHEPLDPWEKVAVIRGGELLPDGRPRFRRILLLVARQNGKTHLLKVLSLYWLFIEQHKLVLGTSTNLEYAKESWNKAVEDAESIKALKKRMPTDRSKGIYRGNNAVYMITKDGCRYKIATATRKGGRSLTINRLVCDELREHQTWDAYSASYNAMNAVKDAQAWFVSNAGDDNSIVLNSLRKTALKGTDKRLGIIEYSALEGCDVMDEEAWRAANPNLGHRLDYDTIRSAALTAKENGGKEEASFRTEVLCQRVAALDAAVDAAAWRDSALDEPSGPNTKRGKAFCLDESPDGLHAALLVAGEVGPGRYRVAVCDKWQGIGAGDRMMADLPKWIEKVKPRTLGWFPNGPAAALMSDLMQPKVKRPGWPPPGVTVKEITGETPAVCMEFAKDVLAGRIEHPDDALMMTQITGAEKLGMGDRWRFTRKGAGPCDVAYGAAGAVYLAKNLPLPKSRNIITAD